MEEPPPQAIANSILGCLPEDVKVEAYVDNDRRGRFSRLLRRDGDGQVHLMGVFSDSYEPASRYLQLLLYEKDRQPELEDAIKRGAERMGYRIKWGPTIVGSSFLYLLETSGTETP